MSLLVSRRDIDFLLHEWLQVARFTQRPRFAEHSRATFDAVIDTYEAIARDEFAPHNKKNDQIEPRLEQGRVVLNPEVAQALSVFFAAGLGAASFDERVGGLQLPQVIEKAGMSLLFAANVSSSAYAFLTMGNAALLMAHASDAIVNRYVRPMLTGRFLGTMCLSEPQAGSSLADITTRAVLQPDGRYRLFGNKMWISGGDHEITENIVHLVLAKIPDSNGRLPPGVQGISLFVVPKRIVSADGSLGARNDVALAGLNHKMGYRGTTNCLLNFGEGRHAVDGAPGAYGEIVGEPGAGLACMFHMMNEARIQVGLGAAALACTGYLHALDYARTRRQGRNASQRDPATPPVAIIAHADVRRMLLAQKCYAEGALALALFCASLVDEQATAPEAPQRAEAQELLDLLTPIAKSWPSQWGPVANDLAIQVHGGYGYTRDYNVEQFYRDNRLNPIHEGTHGIQALDLLGRKLRLHDGRALQALCARMAATVDTARAEAALADDAQRLQQAIDAVMRVTRQLLAEPDARLRLANATPYLEAFGHMVVGWIWLQQACVAQAALRRAATQQAPSHDAGFHEGKLRACRWFMRWELPRIGAWLAVLDPIDPGSLEMPDNAW